MLKISDIGRAYTTTNDPPEVRHLARIWLGWVLASAAGGAVVGALEAGGLQFMATLVLAGFVVGGGQWFVLRSQLPAAWRWPLASGVGLLLGNLLHAAFRFDGELALGLWRQIGLWEVFWLTVITYGIALTVMGLVQWLVLRTRPQANWWVLSSFLGGLALGATSATACYAGCAVIEASAGSVFSTAVTYAAGWATYGLVTGWLMARLLQPYVTEHEEAPT